MPALDPPTLTGFVGAREDGDVIFAFPGGIRVFCVDGSGDECAIACDVEVTVNIVKGNPGNDCNGNTVTVTNIQPNCPELQPVTAATGQGN
jgi:hypothetical protein